MKFDVFSWDEIKTNAEILCQKGPLRLQLSAPCAVYLTAEGVEALAAYGASVDLEISEAVTLRVEAAKGVRAFRHVTASASSIEADGETFTNIDRLPHESGMMAEVTRARRLMEIQHRQMMQDIRIETAKAIAARAPQVIEDDEPQTVETETPSADPA